MENSGYLALARQVALDRALDIAANNVANLRTSGYKAEKLLFQEFMQRQTSPVTPPNEMSSVVQVGTFTDLRPGDFEHTGNSLDFAIQGDGFFAVQTPEGPRYTRAGSFQLDQTGQVVTADGLPVLDNGGSTLQLPPEGREILVDGQGRIEVDGSVVGQIGVLAFADPNALVREGSGLYGSAEQPTPSEDARVIQGMVEAANVQPVLEITRMMDILRSFEAAQKMVDSQHELAMKAIAKIAKV